LCCCLLTVTTVAHAEESPLSGELANGILVFGDGPTPLEVGLSLDLGVSYVFTDYFVARAALGIAGVFDRHDPNFLLHTRVEAAARAKLARFVPLLGAGASTWSSNPAVHGLLGLGLELAHGWQVAVDIRSGLFWDHDEYVRPGFTPYGEGQLRMSWPIK
jgi:hypothetical protein